MADTELPQEWRDKALDEVVEIVLQHFQYPARRRDGTSPRVEFDLSEFVANEMDYSDVVSTWLTMLTDFSSESDLVRIRTSELLEARLREHFEDHDIVIELGSQMMDEAKYD